jgi:hypothetical protein
MKIDGKLNPVILDKHIKLERRLTFLLSACVQEDEGAVSLDLVIRDPQKPVAKNYVVGGEFEDCLPEKMLPRNTVSIRSVLWTGKRLGESVGTIIAHLLAPTAKLEIDADIVPDSTPALVASSFTFYLTLREFQTKVEIPGRKLNDYFAIQQLRRIIV